MHYKFLLKAVPHTQHKNIASGLPTDRIKLVTQFRQRIGIQMPKPNIIVTNTRMNPKDLTEYQHNKPL